MIKRLLILSLIMIPFYEVFLYFFIPGRNFPFFPDMRYTKDFVSLGASIAIGSTVLCRYGFKKLNNIWVPIFLLFVVWNMYKAPTGFIVNNVDFSGVWNYKPAYQLFVYLFLFLGVSNIPNINVDKILKVMSWCGFAMSVLMLMQYFGLDQIFSILPEKIIGSTKHPEMGGTIGQATLSAPFIVMCLPFMIHRGKLFLSLVMATAIVLSGSSFAMLGLVVVCMCSILASKKINNLLLLPVILGCIFFVLLNKDFLFSNGRFDMWKLVISDISTGKICLTGAGIGAFKYLFAMKNGNQWYHAHNEYLQLVWSCGFVGAAICLMIVKDYVFTIFRSDRDNNLAIFISVLGIAVISFGTFPLQLAVYQFYLTVMAGIVYSNNNGG